MPLIISNARPHVKLDISPAMCYLFCMEFDELIEKQLLSRTLFEGRVINLRLDDVLLPNGKTSSREYVEHRGGAAVLAVDNDGYVYFVRQFRYPYREVLLEIPAGKLEKGEKPAVAAARELEEETGLVAATLQPYGVVYPSPGYTNEKLYIFKAEGASLAAAHPDEDEFLRLVRMPFADALDMALSGKIPDAKTCYAILKYAVELARERK